MEAIITVTDGVVGNEGAGVVGVSHAAHHQTAVAVIVVEELEVEPFAVEPFWEPRRNNRRVHIAGVVAAVGVELNIVHVVGVGVARMAVAIGSRPTSGKVVDVVLLRGNRVAQRNADWHGDVGCKCDYLEGLPLAVEFLRLAGGDDAHIVSGGGLKAVDLKESGTGQYGGVEMVFNHYPHRITCAEEIPSEVE